MTNREASQTAAAAVLAYLEKDDEAMAALVDNDEVDFFFLSEALLFYAVAAIEEVARLRGVDPVAYARELVRLSAAWLDQEGPLG